MLDLAFADQIFHRAGNVLDRNVRIDAVLVEEVDDVGFQALQRCFGDGADVFRPAVHAALAAVGTEVEAELRGDDDLVPDGAEGFAQQFLVLVRPVGFRRVEEGDAPIEGGADQLDRFLLLSGRTIAVAQAHASETESRDFETAFSEFTLLHQIFP